MVNNPKILVINDSPGELVKLIMETDINAEIMEAQFGTEALRALMKHDYSLILFDIHTSDLMGCEMIQWTKQEEKTKLTPIVVITSDIDATFANLESYDVTSVDSVLRPVNKNALRGKIKQFLELGSGLGDSDTEIEEPHENANDFSGTEILLVEDNQTNRMIAEMMLEDLGCRVTMAEDGEEALSLLERKNFQLIFMDCHMPNMDGYEAATIIKNRMRNGDLSTCPVIAFTANERKDDRTKCAKAGMNDYISKPVHEDALKAVLSKWVA